MKDIIKEIEDFVLDYFKVYFKDRDYQMIKKYLSSDMTVIGTGAHEYGSNGEETSSLYQKDLNEVSTPVQFSRPDMNIQVVTTDIAIVSGKLSIKGESNGIKFSIPELRFTLTIKKENESWVILHHHISVPNDQQVDEELYPLQKIMKQNELLNQMVEERTRELKNANRELQQSNSTKDKLLSVISHDLRNPFNSILGFIKVLREQYDEFDSKSRKEFISIIDESSHKVYYLLDNLLTWSKLQRNGFEFSPEAINLSNVFESVLDTFSGLIGDKQIEIANKVDNRIQVLSDEIILTTIVRNLLANAIKFTPQGGKVTLFHQPGENGNITIGISDTGIGIEKARLKTLFDNENNISTIGTHNEVGTGLGLALCKEFIDMHQTSIWAESTVGVGSTFYFTLKKN